MGWEHSSRVMIEKERVRRRRGEQGKKKKVQKNGETVRVTSDFVYVNDSLFFFFFSFSHLIVAFSAKRNRAQKGVPLTVESPSDNTLQFASITETRLTTLSTSLRSKRRKTAAPHKEKKSDSNSLFSKLHVRSTLIYLLAFWRRRIFEPAYAFSRFFFLSFTFVRRLALQQVTAGIQGKEESLRGRLKKWKVKERQVTGGANKKKKKKTEKRAENQLRAKLKSVLKQFDIQNEVYETEKKKD